MPPSETEQTHKLLRLIHDLIKEIHPHFSKEHISLEDDFETDLGLDSLSRVELVSRVQEDFQVTIDDALIYEIQTPSALLAHILSAHPKSSGDSYDHHTQLIQEDLHELPEEAHTLVDVLNWHVKNHPDRVHIQLYEDDAQGERITFMQLKQKAIQVASSLQALGLQSEQAVAIMLPTSAEYFYTFFGILFAGGIPVPIYPPARASQLQEHMQRHTRILENAQTQILITIPEAKLVAQLLKSHVLCIEEIVTPNELLDTSSSTALPKLKSEQIAFIQYTSGSTGDPKGVMLSHANLLANIRAMGKAVEATSEDVFISWLPLYHDMGLIGAWLGSLYHASLFVVMSPLAFLSKPERWLRAIHHYKGTLSAAPNFAYEYTLHRLKDTKLQGLDLNSWRAAFNGAEAVSPVTIKKFSDFFQEYGFDPKVMTPVYGLAESSVGLTFPPMKRGPLVDHIDRDTFMKEKIAKAVDMHTPDSMDFISSGLPITGHQIRIVDEYGHELPERHEGTLQFQGPSSTRGYYRNPEKSEMLFDDGWLNSGDRAYISQGELYLTGRQKDIIIRAGRNIYPDQLEKAVGNIEGIRKGCVAIFGTLDQRSGTERLVILAESKLTDETLRDKAKKEILELSKDILGVPADEVVLSEPGTVLKTSSGKIRRDASRELFEKNGPKAQSQNLIWQFIRLGARSFFPRIKRLLHQFIKQSYNLYAWSIFILIVPLSWLSVMLLPQKAAYTAARLYAKSICFLTRIPIHVHGAEGIADYEKPYLFIVNHASYIDSFVLFATLPLKTQFVAKAELQEHWYTRLPLRKLGVRFVQRYAMQQSLQDIQQIRQHSKERAPLLFFPEGTFSRVPGLKPFHMGAFQLAVQEHLDIVPIVITGTRSILRPDNWFIHQGTIEVSFMPIITLDTEKKELDQWHQALRLSQQSREAILSCCKEPDLEYEGKSSP